MKIKNVRAGIVIIADAGIKLAPGETMEIDNPTRQTLSALAGGILARIDAEPESRPKAKSAGRAADGKSEQKKTAAPASTEKQATASEAGQSADGDQGQLPEVDDVPH